MAIVKNTLRLPGASGTVVNRTVSISLVSGSAGGFVGSSTEILSKRYVQTDATGLWSIDLDPNSTLTPTNTYYTVQQFGETLSFVVPNTAGPFWLKDILVQSPSSPSGLVVGVLASRQIIAGSGLTGGGDLTADRTLTVSYGTASGTAAQGDDSRITGAAQKAANLSDLASATTARTNLGLAAVAASGSATDITTGTLAAARVGDLSATYALVAEPIAVTAQATANAAVGLAIVLGA
jgi:hypothetical protein